MSRMVAAHAVDTRARWRGRRAEVDAQGWGAVGVQAQRRAGEQLPPVG
jgi:hypothetical protein